MGKTAISSLGIAASTYAYSGEIKCSSWWSAHFLYHFELLFGVNLLSTLLCALTAWASAQGAITQEEKRRWVPWLLWARVPFFCIATAWTGLFLIQRYPGRCPLTWHSAG